MKIGIDIDDVIVDFLPSFINFYNERYNKNIRFEDMTSFFLWEVGVGTNRKDVIKFVDEFYDSENFYDMPLIAGAKEAINLLSKEHEIYIITSRPIKLKEKTIEFFKINFPDIDLKIFFSKGIHHPGDTKSEISKRLGLSIFIEDNYIEGFDLKRTKVFLMNKPWNKDFSDDKIIKTDGWSEILENLNGYREVNNAILT